MVQGNWQRRAEMSETRRLEAKQRKQRNAERKNFKSQAQDLMSFLNRNGAHIFRTHYQSQTSLGEKTDVTIHIWTDTQPCSEDGSPSDELWEEDHTANNKRKTKQKGGNMNYGRRDRSISVENEESGRSAKGYKNNVNGKKKSHPRSKDNSTSNIVEASKIYSTHKPKLYRSHFFDERCNGSTNKKGGSGAKKNYDRRFTHYPKKDRTLHEVLFHKLLRDGDHEDSVSSVKKILLACDESHPSSIMPGDKTPTPEAMDMVYYLSFTTDELFGGFSNDGELSCQSFSPAIVDVITKQSCNIGSIVYFAVGNQLLYDRYRKGIVVEESQMIGLERHRSPTGKNASDANVGSMHLSASILEYILTFLDDKAVASMASVCRSWNREIGKQSENLWKFLLQRRQWPFPHRHQVQNQIAFPTLRGAFVSHYTAVREANAVKTGIDCLLTRKSMNEYDGSIRSFESLRNSPEGVNYCMGVKIWASNHLLAGYSEDCTVRLFDSVDGSESSGERLCRELICWCVDPYQKTKKKNCTLLAMALDEDYIGCILQVADDISSYDGFILTVLSRDSFLIDDGSNDETVQVIDIRQAVLNFLLSCDDVDHSLLELRDYLSNEGDLDDIEVIASRSLAECGSGRFMVEVSVIIASDGIYEDSLLFRKLFLFSTSVGAITWMSDSGSYSAPFRHWDESMKLFSVKTEENGRNEYDVLSLLCFSDTIINHTIDSVGNVNRSMPIQGTDLVRQELLRDGWVIKQSSERPVAVIKNLVVVADNLCREEIENQSVRSVVSFYTRRSDDSRSVCDSLNLIGNLVVCHLIALGNSHVIAICRSLESDTDAIDGHWFGPNATPTVLMSMYAILIDVESRSEIYRTCLLNNLNDLGNSSLGFFMMEGEFPIHLAIDGDTAAAALTTKGVVLTGADCRRSRANNVRSNQELMSTSKSAKKAKKKKIAKKGGKKDGYARGLKS